MFDLTFFERLSPLATTQIIISLATLIVILFKLQLLRSIFIYLFLYASFLVIAQFSHFSIPNALPTESIGLILSILLFHVFQKSFYKIRFYHLLLDVCVVGMATFGFSTQQVQFASLVYTALSINTLSKGLQDTNQYLHRNRMYYWLPVVLVQILADSFFFDPTTASFYSARLGLLVYFLAFNIVKTLPDIKFVLLNSLQKIFLIGFVSSYALSAFFVSNLIVEPTLKWVFIALAMVLITFAFQTISDRLMKVMQTLFKMNKIDPQMLLSEFDGLIRKTFGLSTVVETINLFIKEKMHANSCKLVLVDKGKSTNGLEEFTLQEFGDSLPESRGQSLILAKSDKLVTSFLTSLNPILSYDLDFSSEYEKVSKEIKGWFKALGGELLIPIFEKQNWIGLLVVGPRKKNRYDPSEVVFLKTLSMQIGATLENARLIEKLTYANDELQETIETLENISHDLTNLETIKSNFISIASHELRTPLTVTRGYVEMLMDDETLPITQRDLLKGIYKGVLKQEAILDSLFELAKLDSSSEQLRSEEISLNDLIVEVSQKMMKVINQRQQVLLIDLPQLPKILGDKGSIRRLFFNILQNAVKFTPDHGRITITGFVADGTSINESGVEMIVRDTGVGIGKELQEVIFTRFYQPGEKIDTLSSSKFKFKGSGLGLGLALSRAIVKAHGGRIWANSAGYDERGLPGSEFHIFFPFKPQNIPPGNKKDQ